MKLLIIGHGRHGKDTVCEILRDYHGRKFISSSRFVCEECIWEDWGKTKYPDIEACYEDRHNYRSTWFQMISQFNTPNKARTAMGMLYKGYDIYCGMRKMDEFIAAKALFDKVVWVDRSKHCPPESADSMELVRGYADIVIDNNADLRSLWLQIDLLVQKGEL